MIKKVAGKRKLHDRQSAANDLKYFYIGRKQFIDNKRAVGRHKDLADIEMLEADD